MPENQENTKNTDCIFCKIANKEIPTKPVLENNDFIAFYDINPISKGHTLVIPKKHIKDFTELSKQDAQFIKTYLEFIEQVRQKLKEYYPKTRGIKVNWNTDGLLEVFHVHCHLVPVY